LTTVLLVGLGAVGGRAARQLVESAGVDHVLVTDRRADRAEALARVMDVEAIDWNPDHPPPAGVDAVAAAVAYDEDLVVARCAVEAGVPFVTAADDHDAIAALIALEPLARAAGVTLAGGCGLAPGLSDVLARHAAAALGTADEVHVARAGVAGPASARVLRRNREERAREWQDGEWVEPRGAGPELVWFPDPIGARDCEIGAGGTALLVRDLPDLGRATFRLAEPAPRRWSERVGERLTRRGDQEGWGATRVEVHGSRNAAREVVVYGVVERTAVAAGTVLALAAAHVCGALALGPRPRPGVHGLAGLVDPVRFLAELTTRGVRAAAFEGVPVA
jgi:hypothetical protein